MNREADLRVLSALQGIKCLQHDFQKGYTDAAAELVRYYREIPEDVTRRLSELTPCLEKIKGPPWYNPKKDTIREASRDAAFQQVIRAANVFRVRLNLKPLGTSGWPEKEDGMHG